MEQFIQVVVHLKGTPATDWYGPTATLKSTEQTRHITSPAVLLESLFSFYVYRILNMFSTLCSRFIQNCARWNYTDHSSLVMEKNSVFFMVLLIFRPIKLSRILTPFTGIKIFLFSNLGWDGERSWSFGPKKTWSSSPDLTGLLHFQIARFRVYPFPEIFGFRNVSFPIFPSLHVKRTEGN